jgi:hypothetical protein
MAAFDSGLNQLVSSRCSSNDNFWRVTLRALVGFLGLACLLCTANVATGALLPDLDISFTWQQTGPCKNGTCKVKFTVKIKNVGDAPAEPSGTAFGVIDVLLFSDEAQQPTGDEAYKGDMEKALPPEIALAPGATAPLLTYVYDYEVAGTYHAWAIVDSLSFYPDLIELSLAEKSKDNNIFDAVLTLTPDTPSLPDLVLQGVNAVVQGDSVNFNITAKNMGLADATGQIFVDVMIDPPFDSCPPAAWNQDPVTVFGDIFESWESGLKKNASHVLAVGPIVLPPGQHTACAAIDIQNQTVELTETNNHFPLISFNVELPPEELQSDLQATYISAKVEGNKVILSGEIKNTGTTQSPPFDAEIYFHALSHPVPGENPGAIVSVDALGPGASTPVSFVWEPAPNGSYIPWLCADLQKNQVSEKNNDNNCIEGMPYEVALAGQLPDLTITDLSFLPIGSDVEYTVTIANQGTSVASDVYIDIFFDEPANPDCFTVAPTSPQGFVVVPIIDPGSQATVKVVWKNAPAGNYLSWAKCDCLNSVSELDETNNDKGPIEVTVQDISDLKVDLAVVDFISHVECTNVVYQVTIINHGDDPAGVFQVDIFTDQKNNPGFGSPGEFTFIQEDGLGAGEKRVLTIKNWKEAEDGSYESWVVVNTKNEVNETDYSNNASGPRDVVVDGQGTKCPDNLELAGVLDTGCCSCAQKTVFEGYCCFGDWNIEPFEICEDSGGTGTGTGTGTGQDDFGNDGGPDVSGESGLTFNSGLDIRGETVGCQQGPAPGQPTIPIAVLLLVFWLAVRRRTHSQ